MQHFIALLSSLLSEHNEPEKLVCPSSSNPSLARLVNVRIYLTELLFSTLIEVDPSTESSLLYGQSVSKESTHLSQRVGAKFPPGVAGWCLSVVQLWSGWEILGDISYDKATLQIRGYINKVFITSLIEVPDLKLSSRHMVLVTAMI